MVGEHNRAQHTFMARAPQHVNPALCGGLYQFKRIPFGVTNVVAVLLRVINHNIKISGIKDTFAYLDNATLCGYSEPQHDGNLWKFLDTAKRYQFTLIMDKCTCSSSPISMLGYSINNGQIQGDPGRLKPLTSLPHPFDVKTLRKSTRIFAHYSR